jgi:hypothetical protein
MKMVLNGLIAGTKRLKLVEPYLPALWRQYQSNQRVHSIPPVIFPKQFGRRTSKLALSE